MPHFRYNGGNAQNYPPDSTRNDWICLSRLSVLVIFQAESTAFCEAAKLYDESPSITLQSSICILFLHTPKEFEKKVKARLFDVSKVFIFKQHKYAFIVILNYLYHPFDSYVENFWTLFFRLRWMWCNETHTHIRTHTHTHTHTYTRIHAHTHAQTHEQTRTYTYIS